MAILQSISSAKGGAQQGLFLPTAIISEDLISPTSKAHECFVNQKFSANLQAMLISYVVSVSSEYSVYV